MCICYCDSQNIMFENCIEDGTFNGSDQLILRAGVNEPFRN